jgi:2'-5' RNA ligase
MRLFLAVNLPPEQRERIRRAAEPLRSARLPVRWVTADALHLTLKFLGEVPEARVSAITEAADAVAARFPSVTLELGGVGAFPNLRSPRVVWVGMQAPPELARLAAQIEEAMAGLGFARENRPFSPHLTLGRAERDARAGDFQRLPELAAAFDYAARVEVSSVDLMRSHLSPAGARYERLHAAPLRGGAGEAGAAPPAAGSAGADPPSGGTGP